MSLLIIVLRGPRHWTANRKCQHHAVIDMDTERRSPSPVNSRREKIRIRVSCDCSFRWIKKGRDGVGGEEWDRWSPKFCYNWRCFKINLESDDLGASSQIFELCEVPAVGVMYGAINGCILSPGSHLCVFWCFFAETHYSPFSMVSYETCAQNVYRTPPRNIISCLCDWHTDFPRSLH